MDKLKNVDPKKLFARILQTQHQKINKTKIDKMCPFYAYNEPCINTLKNDYCHLQHNEKVKMAMYYQINCLNHDTEANEKILLGLVLTEDEKETEKNKKLLLKFPNYPPTE